jgi:hypothetical protein
MDLNDNICFSGGARGADHAWGLMAEDQGHRVIHFSFKGHKTSIDQHVQILTREELDEAEQWVVAAAKPMKRRYVSAKDHVKDLLRRNWHQIRFAERVYAVAKLVKDDPGTLKISGGTAWSAQMYVERWYAERNFAECELYLFDMESNKWMQWWETWKVIDNPPAPHGRYAAVGSRDITDAGVEAIFRAYG